MHEISCSSCMHASSSCIHAPTSCMHETCMQKCQFTCMYHACMPHACIMHAPHASCMHCMHHACMQCMHAQFRRVAVNLVRICCQAQKKFHYINHKSPSLAKNMHAHDKLFKPRKRARSSTSSKGRFTRYDFCLRLSHAIFIVRAARVMEKSNTFSMISNCLWLRLS